MHGRLHVESELGRGELNLLVHLSLLLILRVAKVDEQQLVLHTPLLKGDGGELFGIVRFWRVVLAAHAARGHHAALEAGHLCAACGEEREKEQLPITRHTRAINSRFQVVARSHSSSGALRWACARPSS